MIADLLSYFGRLHPFVVHLPIGALILALLLDLLAYQTDRSSVAKAIRISLLIGFVSAIVACVLGYVLSLTVEYNVEILDRHMYSGIVLAVVSGILYFIAVPAKVFTGLLLLMSGLLAYVGDQGGNLTYGDDYFTRQEKIDSVFIPVVEVIDSADLKLINTLRDEGVIVRVMLQRPLMLDVTITLESQLNVNDLLAVAPSIILFNASGNNLRSSDLSYLKDFTNLEKLRLEKNPVDDAVVENLLELKHLVAVNLNETKITKAGVSKLKTNPSIQRVYTWRTKAE